MQPDSIPSDAPPPRYSWRLLRAGAFRLDAGAMFGLIPRSVWSRAAPTDERGRIQVQHNCLLLERLPLPEGEGRGEGSAMLSSAGPQEPLGTSGPPGGRATEVCSETSVSSSGPQDRWGPAGHPGPLGTSGPPGGRILIESGTGDKLDAKSRDIFALEDRSISTALAEIGVGPESIGAVVVSHLHFDHAGGLTRLVRAGETPDWTGPASTMAGSRPDHGVKLTFPNARVYTQAREWRDAIADRSVMTRTYFRDHLEPIRDRVALIDSPPPFAAGEIPDRDELPRAPVSLRMTEALPGIFVFRVPGHTWGQQAVMFTDDQGRTVVFTPDVMPTRWHVGAAYNLGYDVEPYTSMISRRWFLAEAAARDWLLCLDHEAGNPLCRVKENGKGWYDLIDA